MGGKSQKFGLRRTLRWVVKVSGIGSSGSVVYSKISHSTERGQEVLPSAVQASGGIKHMGC